MRKFKLTWSELQKILHKEGKVFDGEQVKELTLVKPRELLIRTEQR